MGLLTDENVIYEQHGVGDIISGLWESWLICQYDILGM